MHFDMLYVQTSKIMFKRIYLEQVLQVLFLKLNSALWFIQKYLFLMSFQFSLIYNNNLSQDRSVLQPGNLWSIWSLSPQNGLITIQYYMFKAILPNFRKYYIYAIGIKKKIES